MARVVVVSLEEHHFMFVLSDLNRAEAQRHRPKRRLHLNVVLSQQRTAVTELLTQIQVDQSGSTNDAQTHARASVSPLLKPAAFSLGGGSFTR